MLQMTQAQLLGLLLAIIIQSSIFYLYYKEELKEDFVILWVILTLLLMILFLWGDLLIKTNEIFVKADRLTDCIIAAYILILVIIGIFLSVKVSKLEEKIIKLGQKIALIERICEEAHNE